MGLLGDPKDFIDEAVLVQQLHTAVQDIIDVNMPRFELASKELMTSILDGYELVISLRPKQ